MKERGTGLGARTTPVAHRIFLLLVMVTASARAQAQSLTEADVIRIARADDPQLQVARESAAVAAAEEIRASLYPNPSITWDREHLPVGAPATEDSLFITVPIDFTGRRPAQRALARSGTFTAQAHAKAAQSAVIKRALEVFYSALAAEQEAKILAGALARLQEAVRVVSHRHEAGTTSGYERMRVEIEAALAQNQLKQTEARARGARATLAALLGQKTVALQLRGDFTTRESVVPRTAQQRPSVRLLNEARAQVNDARSSARWAWVPTLSLSGGLRFAETTDMHYGYVAGVSLDLPLFSRGQDVVAESVARQRLASAYLHAAARETRIDEVRAREQLASARAEYTRFTVATRDRIELLERAALSGYREGDRSVVELVDAQRARTEVDRQRLALEMLAKQAELDLRAAQGEFE